MSCARCGCGIYKTEEFISLNKVWHKYCFTCYQCSKRLDKDSAKIFQGELFCECCYSNVIEKLFEVISTPSVNKPCKVVSTPSCAVTTSFEERLKNCENCLKNIENCKGTEYCFPAEKKLNDCIQRSALSCSCIPSQTDGKDEYCFVFPIPREVANYYNRAHMKSKACKDPINCNQPQCAACSCRKTCGPSPKCPVQVRTLKNPCCCNSPAPPRCRNPSPQRCCCSSCSAPPRCPVVFKKGCSCCLPPTPPCCEPCPPSKRCSSPYRFPPPCQRCASCPKKTCKPKCPSNPCCPPPKCPPPTCCPPSQCCPPPQCCSPPRCSPSPQCCPPPECCPTPKRYVLPPRCPPSQCCPPSSSCPQKMEGCGCSLAENSSCCKKTARKCCPKQPKYCVCGCLNPCNCKMSQIRAQCTVCCVRCGEKVYAAEKILVSSGSYHTSCFTCFCCNKCLDVKTVFEGCGEVYCKQCYNHFFGVEYYGFGGKNC